MQGIYIPQIDCKDLWISNYGNEGEYSLRKADGSVNINRFKASFDYSLDLVKLREIYESVYRNKKFSTIIDEKEYSYRVINVAFEYSVKEYNRCGANHYARLGFDEHSLEYTDCVAVVENVLGGIILGQPVNNPLPDSMLGKYFKYENGCYALRGQIKTVKNIAAVRRELYEGGFMIDGIKYVRWKRSAGSARVGKCLFIDERLYGKIHKWETCGLNFKDGDSIDLAAFESYISLTSSSMVDTININPDNILIIDDFYSEFKDDVVCVTESGGTLNADTESTTVVNNIFDGEAMIDKSLLGKYQDKGMVLLRNRFFKSCAFNCNLQKWFADNNITSVNQLNGYTRAERIEDVKLVTTPSSIKFCKFGTIQEWLERIEPTFGLVKYEKPPHFFDGRMVQAHYQLINSIQLSEDEVEELLKPTFDFLTLIKESPAALRYWIKFNINEYDDITPIESKNDVVCKLMSVNNKFTETKLYYDFRANFMKSFTKNLKCGHILINGNYSTICGNPIEMLKHAIGSFDGTGIFSENTVYCSRFSLDESSLLCSRSPHITFSNVLCTVNKRYPEIDKYMNPTDEIIYVNSIGENILERLAGCDFDSDTVMVTDNPVLIKAALRNNNRFAVAVNKVGGNKTKRTYSSKDQADLDIKTSKNLIGEIINVSQELNTLVWDMIASGKSIKDVAEIYLDICKLSIMSNIEIDKAKKEFAVDNAKELGTIRQKYKIVQDDGRQVKPYFFAHIAKRKGYYDPEKKAYIKHDTSMDYLQTSVNRFRAKRDSTANGNTFVPFSEIISYGGENDESWINYRQIGTLLDFIKESNEHITSIYANKTVSAENQHIIANAFRQDCIEYVGEMNFSCATMKALLKLIENPKYIKEQKLIIFTLFGYPNTSFFQVLHKSKGNIPVIKEDKNGSVDIFGIKFRQCYVNGKKVRNTK